MAQNNIGVMIHNQRCEICRQNMTNLAFDTKDQSGRVSFNPTAIARVSALIREWAEMIKLEHTVFALPFALSGLLLASKSLPTASATFWTVLAFGSARAAAMTLNRLLDAEIDSKNPRTMNRAIPAGRINKLPAKIIAILSFGLMLFSAVHLPLLCLWLSPIAVFWLALYSYTKRFTWCCHLFLGVALGGAALGGWIAAGGSLGQWAPWILSLAVTTWVAGFDIIYACQDIDIDRSQRLFSIPARFGLQKALHLSVGLHVLTIACLCGLGMNLQLGAIYWSGVALVASMLIFEHSLVSPTNLSRINAAFFNINGVVSIAAFLAILLDKLF